MEVASFSLPARAGLESEDALAVGDGVVVVVDGAGLPKAMRSGCRHSVAWYARVLAEAFRERLEDAGTAMSDALADTIAHVTAAHAHTCDLDAGSPSATVAAWRLTGDEVEHLVLCDASIVLIARDGTAREITDARVDAAAQRGAAYILGDGPHTDEQIAAARFAALDAARNTAGGFWCCHTDPDAAQHALTGRTALTDLAAIVAASDGGTRGFQLLGAHSIEEFARLASARLLDEIAAAIRAAEGGTDLRLTKRHDDITLAVASF
ncbi:protein phosphatase 2C domain-containing protein [Microbacterium sp.]|uniref:protein phosphatase 2C domain-containing protein n=1 Tax=Microbacterium sp. TaxID=51671 RepID=UPI0028113766|nr:protein phosphatase 2C domain-containing protein [Microbacterium sp.]